MKALIVKYPWREMILSGEKTIELRSRNCLIRGTIGIIESGTGNIYGTVDLVNVIKLTEDDFYKMKNKHKVNCNRNMIPYKNLYGWVFKNPVQYKNPIPYKHKKGCVVWVNV